MTAETFVSRIQNVNHYLNPRYRFCFAIIVVDSVEWEPLLFTSLGQDAQIWGSLRFIDKRGLLAGDKYGCG